MALIATDLFLDGGGDRRLNNPLFSDPGEDDDCSLGGGISTSLLCIVRNQGWKTATKDCAVQDES